MVVLLTAPGSLGLSASQASNASQAAQSSQAAFAQLLSMFSHAFFARALIVGALVALCAALLGVILVLKNYALIGHGLADVGFAALSLAMALNLPPLATSMPIVIAAAFVIMLLARRGAAGGDVAIGMVATVSLSVGVVITALTRGFNMDVSAFMFGSLLGVSEGDVYLSVALCLVVVLLYALFYNRLFLITYDEPYARASGINADAYELLIAFLTAVTVTLGMRMMGTLLMSSLVIFPAMTARRLVVGFRAVVIVSACVSVACFFVGIVASFLLNLPTGASVVLVNVAAMGVAMLWSRLARRR